MSRAPDSPSCQWDAFELTMSEDDTDQRKAEDIHTLSPPRRDDCDDVNMLLSDIDQHLDSSCNPRDYQPPVPCDLSAPVQPLPDSIELIEHVSPSQRNSSGIGSRNSDTAARNSASPARNSGTIPRNTSLPSTDTTTTSPLDRAKRARARMNTENPDINSTSLTDFVTPVPSLPEDKSVRPKTRLTKKKKPKTLQTSARPATISPERQTTVDIDIHAPDDAAFDANSPSTSAPNTPTRRETRSTKCQKRPRDEPPPPVPRPTRPSRSKKLKHDIQRDFITLAMNKATKFAPSRALETEDDSLRPATSTSPTDVDDSVPRLMRMTVLPTALDFIPLLDRPLPNDPVAMAKDPLLSDRHSMYQNLQNPANYTHHNKGNNKQRALGLGAARSLARSTLPVMDAEEIHQARSWFHDDERSCPFCPAFPELFHNYTEFPIHEEYPDMNALSHHVSAYHYPMVDRISCEVCPSKNAKTFLTRAAYRNHLQALQRKEGPHDKHAKKASTLKIDQVYVQTLKQNRLYIPPLVPTRIMPTGTIDGTRMMLTFGPFRFNVACFHDHPANPDLSKFIRGGFNLPAISPMIPVDLRITQCCVRARELTLNKPRPHRLPVCVLPALQSRYAKRGSVSEFYACATRHQSPSPSESLCSTPPPADRITIPLPVRTSSATKVQAVPETPPEDVTLPKFVVPIAIPTRRSRSVSHAPSAEDWDSEISMDGEHPATSMGRPIDRTPATTSTPILASPPTFPRPTLPPTSVTRSTTSSEKSGRVRPRHFGLNLKTPVAETTLRATVVAKDSYRRLPTPFRNRLMQSGPTDTNGTGYAPTVLPDDEKAGYFLQRHSKAICARTFPNISPLPSSERYHTDVGNVFFDAISEKSRRLQALLQSHTNMSTRTAPIDNYAVQARDLLTQVQRAASEANQWALSMTPTVLDATARQYELEMAAATATVGCDSDKIREVQSAYHQSQASLDGARLEIRRLQEENARLNAQARSDRSRINNLSTAVNGLDEAARRKDETIAQLDQEMQIPSYLIVTQAREAIQCHFDDDRAATADDLLDQLDDLIRSWTE